MYRFVPGYRIMMQKPSCIMPAMGKMVGKTAPAVCKKHTSHVKSASIAQVSVFEQRELRF